MTPDVTGLDGQGDHTIDEWDRALGIDVLTRVQTP